MSAATARAWSARLVLAAALPALPAVGLAAGSALGRPVVTTYLCGLALLGLALLVGPSAWPAQSRGDAAETVGVTAVVAAVTALDSYVAAAALSWPSPARPLAIAVAALVYLAASMRAFALGGEQVRLTWPLAPIAGAAAWLAATALV